MHLVPRWFACIATLAALPCSAQSLPPVQLPGRGSIAIAVDADLAFGRLAVLPGGGGALLAPASGTVTATGDLVYLGGPSHAARFTVTGRPLALVSISWPRLIRLRHRGITLDLTLSADSGALIQRLDASGRLMLRLGGSLVVPGGVAEGIYTTNLRVSADGLLDLCYAGDPGCNTPSPAPDAIIAIE
jgi:hypothetical protein